MSSKRLKLDILNTCNIIRNKLAALKEGRAEEEMLQERSYKRVIKSLQNIATRLQDVKKENVKLEPKAETKSFIDTSKSSVVQPRFFETDVLAEHEPSDYDDDPFNENQSITNETIQQMVEYPSFREYLLQYDALPRQYVMFTNNEEFEMITNNEEFDHKYGIRHDVETEKFKMGNKEVVIDGKDIKIENIRYEGTPGLYELVFKKIPNVIRKLM